MTLKKLGLINDRDENNLTIIVEYFSVKYTLYYRVWHENTCRISEYCNIVL